MADVFTSFVAIFPTASVKTTAAPSGTENQSSTPKSGLYDTKRKKPVTLGTKP